MNVARLLFMADYLVQLAPEVFDMQTWVVLPPEHKTEGATLAALPAGAKACPVGWLPHYDSAAWCWCLVDGEAYPVLKSSTLWTAAPGLTRSGTTTEHVTWYVWKQLAEWLESPNLWLLQFMLSHVYYAAPLCRTPSVVADRMRQVAQCIAADDKWETRCPDHPSEIMSYLAVQGFAGVPS